MVLLFGVTLEGGDTGVVVLGDTLLFTGGLEGMGVVRLIGFSFGLLSITLVGELGEGAGFTLLSAGLTLLMGLLVTGSTLLVTISLVL